MALAVYMDVHVPAAVTQGLRERSIDVRTSQDDGTRTEPDETLLLRTVELGRLLFTQDEDFLVIVREWQASGREFPGVFFARQGHPPGRLITDLELHLVCCTADELRNRLIFLPLPSTV